VDFQIAFLALCSSLLDAIPQIVIPVTLIPNKKWYFKKTSRSPSTIKEFGYASKNVE
jgi:hypothetical protein